MGRARWPTLIGWGLLGACSEGAVKITPPPFDATVAATLWIFEPIDQRPLAVHAIDGSLGDRAVSIEIDRPIDHTLSVLHLSRSLEALGIEEGRVSVLSEAASKRRLPIYTQAFSSLLDEDGLAGWAPLGALSARAQQLRIPEVAPLPSDCALFSSRDFEIEGVVTVAVALGDRVALVATEDGEFHRVTFEDERIVTTLTSSTPHAGGISDDRGGAHLVAEDGSVTRVGPELELPVVTRPSGDPPGRMRNVFAIGERRDLGVSTFDGRVLMLQDDTWTPVHRGVDGAKLTVAATGPDELLVATIPNSLTRYRRDGRGFVRSQEALPEGAGEISVVRHVPGVGDLIATLADGQQSRVFQLNPRSNGWELIGAINLANGTGMYDLAPLDDGFLFTGAGGWIGQYVVDRGFCEQSVVPPPLSGSPKWAWNFAVPIGRDYLLVGYERDRGPLVGRGLVWLHRMR